MNTHLRIFLNTKYKVIIFFTIILASFFEFFGLSLIYPFLALLFDLNLGDNNFTNFLNEQFMKFNLPINKITFGTIIIFFVFLKAALLLYYRYITSKSVLAFQQDLRVKIYNGLFLSNFNFLSDKKSRFINALTIQSSDGVSSMQNQYNMLERFISLIGLLILCILLSFKVLLISILIGFCIVLIFNFTFKLSKKWSQALTNTNEEYFRNINQGLNNIKYLKATNLHLNFFREVKPFLKRIYSNQLYFSMLNKGTTIINEPIILSSLAIIFIVGIYFLKLDTVILVAMYLVLGRTFQKALGLINDYQSYSKDLPPTRYCFSLIDEISKDTEKQGNVKFDFLKEKINFKNVNFNYDKKQILNNVSFDLYKNQLNLIYGKSGTGKSTILNLILGLSKKNSGSILINNNDINEIDLNSLRDKIGLVTQENTIFNLSIRDNMKIRNSAVLDEGIIKYIKMFNLDSIFKGENINLNYLVDENSSNLSLGEKQRLALIRELLTEPEILILDEVTSSLDNATVNIILTCIKEISKKITIIAVSHQEEYLKIAENILKLENSSIIKMEL